MPATECPEKLNHSIVPNVESFNGIVQHFDIRWEVNIEDSIFDVAFFQVEDKEF